MKVPGSRLRAEKASVLALRAAPDKTAGKRGSRFRAIEIEFVAPNLPGPLREGNKGGVWTIRVLHRASQ